MLSMGHMILLQHTILSINGPYDLMTCGQATVLQLLNGSVEKTRLLATAFRNNQDQALANNNWVHALTLLFSLGPFFTLCSCFQKQSNIKRWLTITPFLKRLLEFGYNNLVHALTLLFFLEPFFFVSLF
jgi:hypothetical protein